MKRSEIKDTLRDILAAALPEVPVYLDDGTKTAADAMEAELASGTGVCLAIGPILATQRAEAPSRTSLHEEATLSVNLRQNVEKIPASGHDATVTRVQKAVLAVNKLSKTWTQPERTTQLVPDDIGLLTTAIFFTATILT